MKYVVFECEAGEAKFLAPVIFPDAFVHEHVARSLCYSMLRQEPRTRLHPVSAGFVNSAAFGPIRAHGESESLGLKSDPERDTMLMTGCDYGAGFTLIEEGGK